MQAHVPTGSSDILLLTVRAPEDIEFLIKEGEIHTGKAGRVFIIAGADHLTFRVHWHPTGFKVERLDAHGQVLDCRHLLPWEFLDHSVIEALRVGQLFTPSVGRPG